MAFSVRIEAFDWPSKSPVLVVEPKWWDERELRDDERFVHTPDETGSYCDYIAELTRKEFIELHERYRSEATKGVWSGHQDIPPKIALIDSMIELLLDEDDRFIVTVFEWESGY